MTDIVANELLEHFNSQLTKLTTKFDAQITKMTKTIDKLTKENRELNDEVARLRELSELIPVGTSVIEEKLCEPPLIHEDIDLADFCGATGYNLTSKEGDRIPGEHLFTCLCKNVLYFTLRNDSEIKVLDLVENELTNHYVKIIILYVNSSGRVDLNRLPDRCFEYSSSNVMDMLDALTKLFPNLSQITLGPCQSNSDHQRYIASFDETQIKTDLQVFAKTHPKIKIEY
jgi:hypothetical protein